MAVDDDDDDDNDDGRLLPGCCNVVVLVVVVRLRGDVTSSLRFTSYFPHPVHFAIASASPAAHPAYLVSQFVDYHLRSCD